MKSRHYFLFFVLIAIASIAFIKSNWNYIASLPSFSKNKATPISAVSDISLLTTNTSNSVASTPSKQKPSSLIPPCDQISDEELAAFPGATVIESAQGIGPKPDQTLQLRLLKTNFKDPYIRTEEVRNNDTGAVVSRREMSADHLVVSLPKNLSPKDFLHQMNVPGASITPITSHGPWIFQIPGPTLASLSKHIPQTIKNGAQNACPDFIIQALEEPYNFNNIKQWGLAASYGGVNAIDAWTIRTGAPSTIVAIIDSGINYHHVDLVMNMWHNSAPISGDVYGTNAVANNSDPMDDNGHGTHCAGTIGGINQNGIGVTGIAQKVQIMACKFMDKNGIGMTSDALACINYAINHGAKILNCSWCSLECSNYLYDEMKYAQSKGVIIVAAAGNDSRDNDQLPLFPASFSSDSTNPRYPFSKLDNIIAVAASTPNDELADFSNYGATSVQLAAPGIEIYSDFIDSNSSHAIASGTSMAAPYVTGAIALLEAEYPSSSYDTLITQMLNTSDKVPALAGKVSAGRLNIARALRNNTISRK